MRFRKTAAILLALAVLCAFAGCGENAKTPGANTAPTVDPHAGMIEVPDGSGGYTWVTLYEDLPVNDLDPGLFYADGDAIGYSGTDYTALGGIDVSFYQGDIDWQAVAASGVQFAVIRVGYRGWTEGELYEDEKFREYIRGALDAGLQVGAYFFSQAVNVAEAVEEAQFVIERIGDYDVSLPVFFDWEGAGVGAEARTHLLDGETLTDCCVAFCDTVRTAGYTPGVYFYRSLGYGEYELDRLSSYVFWFSGIEAYPTFHYRFDMWQYAFTGRVDGIDADVDLDLYFVKNASGAEASPSPSPPEAGEQAGTAAPEASPDQTD